MELLLTVYYINEGVPESSSMTVTDVTPEAPSEEPSEEPSTEP